MQEIRVGVIGAGIVGLSHAWMAAERGHRVTVFERSPRAMGASIRNFGMVWPIGQPTGVCHEIALRSRDRWLQLSQSANLWTNRCGSIHVAHRQDEWEVLSEFQERSAHLGYDCSLLSKGDIVARFPVVNPEKLIGGLYSPSELGVNPRAAIRSIPSWLIDSFGVEFHFETTITQVDGTSATCGDGRKWEFDRIIVCGGADFETLFPEVLASSGMRLCKLQMLKTSPQLDGWQIGPLVASGLTLRHYKNFEICSSLTNLKQRIADETPELDRFGIHVMASQTDDGSVILGDSHEYGAEIEPFDKAIIDDLIIRELRSIIRLPHWSIAERWNGVYAKHPEQPIFTGEPSPNVFVRYGPGGAGMTMAFGLAERDWQQWS